MRVPTRQPIRISEFKLVFTSLISASPLQPDAQGHSPIGENSTTVHNRVAEPLWLYFLSGGWRVEILISRLPCSLGISSPARLFYLSNDSHAR